LTLREDDFVLNDETTSRLDVDCYVMTITTANAVRMFQHLRFCHQALWPDHDAQIVSMTDQWA
jgi:methylglutamate dehydrogenase subunit C